MLNCDPPNLEDSALAEAYGLNDTQGNIGNFFERASQIWKNAVILFEGRNRDPDITSWPDWLVDRLSFTFLMWVEGVDMVLDFMRSLFANIYSRKLPQYGNINEKVMWKDLKAPLIANILALNKFAHHDIITLPMGINQTVTTETLDVVDDTTSRILLLGGIFNTIVRGFHNLAFGASPSGFKKGGVDYRLQYYGDTMVGIMSAEMYYSTRLLVRITMTGKQKDSSLLMPFKNKETIILAKWYPQELMLRYSTSS